MHHDPRSALLLGATVLTALALAGCGAEGSKPASPKAKPREVINKTTQKVMRLQEALSQGGQVATGSGTVGPDAAGEGYLGALAQANRSARSSIATMAVTQRMQMHEALNEPIKDYDEFMQVIVQPGQPDGLQLPQLPYYQEYAYDEANRQLVVVEFPEKKAEFEKTK
jgi:hypothetical protein